MKAPKKTTCPCGQPDDHIVARGWTSDRIHVLRWCSGMLTDGAGNFPRGCGSLRDQAVASAAAEKLWPHLTEYTWAELPTAMRVARDVVKQEARLTTN